MSVTAVGSSDGQMGYSLSVCLKLIYQTAQWKPLDHRSFISYCGMRYAALSTFENRPWKTFWVSREQRSPSAAASFSTAAEWAGSSPQDLICEWTSVQYRVTMRLIDENLHCLCSRSQRSPCTKQVLSQCLTSRLCRKGAHLYRNQVKNAAKRWCRKLQSTSCHRWKSSLSVLLFWAFVCTNVCYKH